MNLEDARAFSIGGCLETSPGIWKEPELNGKKYWIPGGAGQPTSVCPICKNKGVIHYLKDGYEFAKPCECMKLRESLRRIWQSGLGDLLNEYTFDKFQTESPWQEADVYKRQALGYTEHSFAHVTKVARFAKELLLEMCIRDRYIFPRLRFHKAPVRFRVNRGLNLSSKMRQSRFRPIFLY